MGWGTLRGPDPQVERGRPLGPPNGGLYPQGACACAHAPSRVTSLSYGFPLHLCPPPADKPMMIIAEYMENGALDKFLRVRMWAVAGRELRRWA